jgi:hypothetical protein
MGIACGSVVAMATSRALAPVHVERQILSLRSERVMIDADLAALYGVPTKALIQAVKRNSGRFPADFMFQLTAEEHAALKSQFVTSKPTRGGRRTAPYAFTEQGVAMLSSVLRSPRAVHVNVEIMVPSFGSGRSSQRMRIWHASSPRSRRSTIRSSASYSTRSAN